MKIYRSKFYSWWTSQDHKQELGVHLGLHHKDLDVTTRIDLNRLKEQKQKLLYYYKYNIH